MTDELTQETGTSDGDAGLTHPDKVLYPEQGLTKRDLARYYDRVAELMLPHVAGRPLSLVRCPEGRRGACFYQKHLGARFPEALHSVAIRQSDGIRPYAVVEDAAGLRALVQIGVLELHVWGARVDRVEAPDRIVFDLDPGSGVTWPALCEGAVAIRDRLADVGLRSWVKTSGGKGIHVVVPIERRSTWEAVAGFARWTAEALAEQAPDRFVSRAAKAARPGRIFIDWLRNSRGATAVGVWSTRARVGAPVSRPCAWSELVALGAADTLRVATVLSDGLPFRTDPWRELATTRQRLRSALR